MKVKLKEEINGLPVDYELETGEINGRRLIKEKKAIKVKEPKKKTKVDPLAGTKKDK